MNSNHLIQSNPYVAVLQIQAIEGNMIRTHQEHIFSIGRLLLGSIREGGKPITPNASRIFPSQTCGGFISFFRSLFDTLSAQSLELLSLGWCFLYLGSTFCHWMKLGKFDVSTCFNRPTDLYGVPGADEKPVLRHYGYSSWARSRRHETHRADLSAPQKCHPVGWWGK